MEFNDVRLQYEQLLGKIDSAVRGGVSSGRYILSACCSDRLRKNLRGIAVVRAGSVSRPGRMRFALRLPQQEFAQAMRFSFPG